MTGDIQKAFDVLMGGECGDCADIKAEKVTADPEHIDVRVVYEYELEDSKTVSEDTVTFDDGTTKTIQYHEKDVHDGVVEYLTYEEDGCGRESWRHSHEVQWTVVDRESYPLVNIKSMSTEEDIATTERTASYETEKYVDLASVIGSAEYIGATITHIKGEEVNWKVDV